MEGVIEKMVVAADRHPSINVTKLQAALNEFSTFLLQFISYGSSVRAQVSVIAPKTIQKNGSSKISIKDASCLARCLLPIVAP